MWSSYYAFSRVAIVPNAITKIAPSGDQYAGNVFLQWQPDSKAQSYLITIESNKDGVSYKRFKTLIFKPKTSGADRVLIKNMKPGLYRWFIQGKSMDGLGPTDLSGMVFHLQ